MAFFTALLARWGLSQRAGLIASAFALIALCGLLAGLWLHFHDKGVVRQHEAGVTAAVTAATSAAEATANANDAMRAVQRAADDQDLRKAIEHVQTIKPDAARGAAGPAVNAVAERLRRRQREAGQP